MEGTLILIAYLGDAESLGTSTYLITIKYFRNLFIIFDACLDNYYYFICMIIRSVSIKEEGLHTGKGVYM